MEGKKKGSQRTLNINEWLLVGMIAIGVILIALKWEHISHEVSESIHRYFGKAE